MRIQKTGTRRSARASAFPRRTGAAAAKNLMQQTLGIPPAEFTSHVRDAVMILMSDVDLLHRELLSTRARLEEVEKSADQDQLLPLLNRRAFLRELTRHIAITERYGTPASLIYFDLDDFKRINDTHGHAGGDAVLANFAQVLLKNVRGSDVVGRLGGDEFGVLLSHASQKQAHRKADLLANQLHASPTRWLGKPIATRFSCGAFELKPGQTADSAMARADEAMYAHKRSSR